MEAGTKCFYSVLTQINYINNEVESFRVRTLLLSLFPDEDMFTIP